MKARECNCEYWEPNISKIISALKYADFKYPKVFDSKGIHWLEYCPWCGKKLIEVGKDIPKYTLDDNFMPKIQEVNLVDISPVVRDSNNIKARMAMGDEMDAKF